jgi:hypothetical protein
MRLASALLLVIAHLVITSREAGAQDPPPPIGPYVFDLRATAPGFPNAAPLAESRGLLVDELPGRGLGAELGAHVYVFRWKAVTFGLGAQLVLAQAHADAASPPGQPPLRAVTERFTSFSPQLSFNFGSGDGWSYISAGIGRSQWSVVLDGASPQEADEEVLRSINYGGGARWFIKRRLAFTFDVRFHDVDPGTPFLGRPASPRARLVVMGAGISIR